MDLKKAKSVTVVMKLTAGIKEAFAETQQPSTLLDGCQRLIPETSIIFCSLVNEYVLIQNKSLIL